MRVKRAGLVAASVAAAALTVGVPAEAAAPEADVAYHGYASLWEGRLGIWLTPQNHGPVGVTEATVRLRYSVPLANDQRLPERCLRAGQRVVLCSTGEIKAGSWSEEIALDIRLKGAPSEATVQIDTLWNGGVSDRNVNNNRHKVLTLDTGDSYFF
ncbi:hypothetical protein H9Y04_39760 [Streptomyces sp. TRM66268-LWL]|uniref:Uncharacterized protein n=1 Tax=Streptomyces polyasparticus TaxID=2767826 RepID=A0ABR7ST62_9ACTN|nr:hypothetical protein [Streptomyces polyasparticus]MBC9718680.1 hypothetical protein [Streptomyces polyasparticus]